MEELKSVRERLRILQLAFNIVVYRSSALKGLSSLGPTSKFGQELIELFIMVSGMHVMTSHMCTTYPKDCLIIPPLFSAFITIQNLGIHSYFVTRGQMIEVLRI